MMLLDRYLTKRLLFAMIVIMALLIALVLGLDVLLRFKAFLRGTIGDDQQRWLLIIQLLAMRIPQMISPLLPVALVGAIIITLAPMLKRGELTALVATGVSLRRCCRSIVMIALGLGVFDVLLSDQIIPRLETPIMALDDSLTGRSQRGQTWHIPATESYWYAGHVTLGGQDGPLLRDIIVATPNGRMVTAAELQHDNHQWTMTGGVTISHSHDPEPTIEQLDSIVCDGDLALPYAPDRLAAALTSRYAMTSGMLWQRGGRLNIALIWQRWLRLFTPLLVTMIALPIFVRFTNGERLMTAAIQTILIAIVPVGIQALGSYSAESSRWSPALLLILSTGIAAVPSVIAWLRWRA